MLINNVLTKQWCLDKTLDVARVRVVYEAVAEAFISEWFMKLLLKQKWAVKAFISVFVHLTAGYRKSLSWLPSTVFNCLYHSVLSAHEVVPHCHTPSTELILLHDPTSQRMAYILVQLHGMSDVTSGCSYVCT